MLHAGATIYVVTVFVLCVLGSLHISWGIWWSSDSLWSHIVPWTEYGHLTRGWSGMA